MAKVFISSVIDAPVERVWAAIRDFDGLPSWVPAVAVSHVEEGRAADSVGCVRSFTLQDGGHLREQLLALSDLDHSVTYSILVSPMPLTNYVATLRLLPVTDGRRTYAEWTATFDAAEADAPGLVETIGQNVFLAAFNSLKRQLAGHGG